MADKNYVGIFNCRDDPATVGTRWTRWLTAFELYADGKGLIITENSATNKQQRRAQLLHFAGPDVQDIFRTLDDTGTVRDYDKAVNALNAYFVPKVNPAYARHAFRQMTQGQGETVLQFVTRLRAAAKDCGYGEDTENQIRDEVLCKCRSDYLRRKLLEAGQELTMARTFDLAGQCEEVEMQMTKLSVDPVDPSAGHVNRVTRESGKLNGPKSRTRVGAATTNRNNGCYRCGKLGHFGRDPSCPARGKTCRKCGGKNHFAVVCKTKQHSQGRVHCLEYDFAFGVTDGNASSTMNVSVGGVKLGVLIDSGATHNIIDEYTWMYLKSQAITCTSSAKSTGKHLYTYASTRPLQVKGTFTCNVRAGRGNAIAEFLVIKGKGIPLLGKQTATKLGMLKIGVDIAAVAETSQLLKQQYPEVFSGVGKLNTKQISLHIDPEVKPVAQPLRRTPFNLRQKVEKKIKELLDMDIIEPVNGPTPWVNAAVIVPKANGDDIRLCIDMRRANEAIIRERHPIPTVDEVLQSMNGSTVFSKLDLRWGYHQLELTPESREITTFATHAGLYRYKRLLFGVNSASEQYQYEISTALAGIAGVDNISDDIIVHGPDQETHNQRLHKVLERLKECHLTLNAEKCQFNMNKLVFMGILLTDKGIGPTEERVKALAQAREPENVAEVRSFLGLANYSSRFIPQFATLSEPLRRLTKKDAPFVFDAEQKRSFRALKKSSRAGGHLHTSTRTHRPR